MKTKTKVDKDLGKTVERIMDAGFDPSIRNLMDDDVHENLVEKALDGDKAAQVRYLDRFFEVVQGIDEALDSLLLRKVTLLGPEEGVEEFFEEVSDRVILFENEILDMLREHIRNGFPAMEEPEEVELEAEAQIQNPEAAELVFRFWAPGEGTEPVAEFTCMNPEERADYVLTGIDEVIAASYIPDLRGIVEETLHDLKRKEVK